MLHQKYSLSGEESSKEEGNKKMSYVDKKVKWQTFQLYHNTLNVNRLNNPIKR